MPMFSKKTTTLFKSHGVIKKTSLGDSNDIDTSFYV